MLITPPPRALIADDSAGTREVIAAALKACGYEIVAQCQDGAEAVAKAKAYRPNLVTMDIIMLQLSGKDAALQIHEALPDTKILMVTSMSQDGVLKDLRAKGFGILIKPIIHAHQVWQAIAELDALSPSAPEPQ